MNTVMTATNGRASVVKPLMTSQHRKHRGYRTQRVVADYLKRWYPNAESTGAGRTGSDITGVPFDIEVKARTGFDPKAVLNQLKARQTSGLAFGVLRLNGQGEDAGDYCAVIRFEDLCHLIERAEVYGLYNHPERCPKCGDWKFLGKECKTCQIMNSNVRPATQS